MGTTLKYFAELLKLEGAESLADYEHKYWGKYAGITRNTYGNGSSYYIGCYTEKKVLKQILKKAADDAGICEPAMKYEWPLTVREGINRYGKMIHYVINYSEDEKTVGCVWKEVKDLLTGETFLGGEEFSIKEWDLRIFEEV